MDLGTDPIFMYLVVRRSLNLSAGKVGGQIGHAVQYLCRAFIPDAWPNKEEATLNIKKMTGVLSEVEQARLDVLQEESRQLNERKRLAREWDASPSHGKIILGASDSEFERVKLENPHHFLVIDLGHTEVEPNTETTIGMWPMHKSQRTGLLKRLRLL